MTKAVFLNDQITYGERKVRKVPSFLKIFEVIFKLRGIVRIQNPWILLSLAEPTRPMVLVSSIQKSKKIIYYTEFQSIVDSAEPMESMLIRHIDFQMKRNCQIIINDIFIRVVHTGFFDPRFISLH